MKTGHTSTAGYVLVGSATRNGVTVVSVVLGDPSEAARDADSLALLRYGLDRYHKLAATVKGRTYRDGEARPPRPARATSSRPAPSARTIRRGERYRLRMLDAPREIDGPLPAGARVGTIEVRWRGQPVDRASPLVTDAAVSGATVAAARRRPHRPHAESCSSSRVVALGSLQLVLLRRRCSVRRRGRAGGNQRDRMIITVTLNAAIDKSLSVPNFRLGRRHRTVEQTTMPGGKGVNVARTLKTLGQPVIATGFAGGPTGTRIVEQLTEESILNDFVRIREESRTNTAVHDPTNGETTEINERGPAVSGKEIELFRDKLLYLARGADVVVFAGSLPRGVDDRRLRAAHQGAAQARRADRGRRRRRADAPRRPRRARRDLAERHRGRGARRPRVQRRRGPHHRRARDGGARRARGDHDAARRLRRVGRRRRRARCCTACGSSRARRSPRSARATRSSPGSSPRATPARRREECLRFGVACGAESTQRLGAGLIDPREVERLLGEIEIERLDQPAGVG